MKNKLNYWQVAVGSKGSQRNYSEDFIKYGMAFVGGKKNINTIREKINEGDVIVAKYGKKPVAIGKVVSREGNFKGEDDKAWLRDYDGWNLHAYCYVDWRWYDPHHHLDSAKKIDSLTQSTISKIENLEAIEFTKNCLNLPSIRVKYDTEPQNVKTLSVDKIIKFIASSGVPSQEFTSLYNELRSLAEYYYDYGYNNDPKKWQCIREHEIRTFLTIPLLLALGWNKKKIKIELPIKDAGRADIVCFATPFFENKKDDECQIIIETKGFSQGLGFAPDQVRKYAEKFPTCDILIVTNGYCYKAYKREDGEFSKTPTAYLNILTPTERYPLDPDKVAGALEVLELLLPEGSGT